VYADDKKLHFPTWNTELYLEYHRGTYTSQARTKNNNRRNEIKMMNSERFSTIASLAAGQKYPFDDIEATWKILLFNQFHDILPGSSINAVYKDVDKDHAWIAGQANTFIGNAQKAISKNVDTSGNGTPLVLFNGLSWSRDDVVETPLSAGVTEASVYDNVGKEIPAQVITKDDGSKAVIFLAKNIPAMGFAVYSLFERKRSFTTAPEPTVSADKMENEFFTVKVDPTTGWVSSIYDKRNKREIVENGKAAFQLMAYKEASSADAWDPRFVDDGTGSNLLRAA